MKKLNSMAVLLAVALFCCCAVVIDRIDAASDPVAVTQVTAPPVAPQAGSTLDTLQAEFRMSFDPEFTHRITTARLPDEVDEKFFARHIARVVAFRAALRRTVGGK